MKIKTGKAKKASGAWVGQPLCCEACGRLRGGKQAAQEGGETRWHVCGACEAFRASEERRTGKPWRRAAEA